MVDKPIVFNYRDYTNAVDEIKRLKGIIAELENEVTMLRIAIAAEEYRVSKV